MYGVSGWVGFLFFVGVLLGLSALVWKLPTGPLWWVVKAVIVAAIVLLSAVMVINISYSLLRK
jgi:hypothetical protein